MDKKYLVSMLCVSLFVSGCDHYSTKMATMEQSNAGVSSIAPASGGEKTFGGYLAAQYYQLASHEQNVTRDYPAAKQYFTKAEKLSNGKMVKLNKVKNYKLESAEKSELVSAAKQIKKALQDYRIPENRYALAMAHSRYDCWLDEAEEKKALSSCKVEFQQAMNSLVNPYDLYSEEEYEDALFDLDF